MPGIFQAELCLHLPAFHSFQHAVEADVSEEHELTERQRQTSRVDPFA